MAATLTTTITTPSSNRAIASNSVFMSRDRWRPTTNHYELTTTQEIDHVYDNGTDGREHSIETVRSRCAEDPKNPRAVRRRAGDREGRAGERTPHAHARAGSAAE